MLDKFFSRFFGLCANFFGLYAVSLEDQERIFSSQSLHRADALSRLDSILQREFGLNYDETSGMFSEHLVILAALADGSKDIRSILEVGTYDGRTALILARLFPNASVRTIDLPTDASLFAQTYERSGSIKEFAEARDRLISRSENIRFDPMNSLALCRETGEFDLIWIDGAHGYPYVTSDIVNAVRLLSARGILMVDDIWTDLSESDTHYRSLGGYKTLNALGKAGLIDRFVLFNKRLGGKFNHPLAKKYVGFVELNKA